MYQKFVIEKYLFSEILADHLPISKREGWGSLFARFLDVDIWKKSMTHQNTIICGEVLNHHNINLMELNLFVSFLLRGTKPVYIL